MKIKDVLEADSDENTVEFDSNNIKLVGIQTTPNNEKGSVILVHGLTGNKNEHGLYSSLVDRLTREGFSTFRFDLRGHGDSEGTLEGLKLYDVMKDITAAVRFYNKKKPSIIGLSFGAGGAMLYVNKHVDKITSLVLLAPYFDHVSSENDVPTLIIHGTDDSTVPYDEVKKFATTCDSCKFKSIEKADHDFNGFEEILFSQIIQWIKKHHETKRSLR